MSDEQKTSAMSWAQFGVGVVLIGVMLYIHVYVKELPLPVLAIPALLLGIDPTRFFGGRK